MRNVHLRKSTWASDARTHREAGIARKRIDVSLYNRSHCNRAVAGEGGRSFSFDRLPSFLPSFLRSPYPSPFLRALTPTSILRAIVILSLRSYPRLVRNLFLLISLPVPTPCCSQQRLDEREVYKFTGRNCHKKYGISSAKGVLRFYPDAGC